MLVYVVDGTTHSLKRVACPLIACVAIGMLI